MFLQTLVLIEYRRVTDGQTDGVGVASTALAIRRAVKSTANSSQRNQTRRSTRQSHDFSVTELTGSFFL